MIILSWSMRIGWTEKWIKLVRLGFSQYYYYDNSIGLPDQTLLIYNKGIVLCNKRYITWILKVYHFVLSFSLFVSSFCSSLQWIGHNLSCIVCLLFFRFCPFSIKVKMASSLVISSSTWAAVPVVSMTS